LESLGFKLIDDDIDQMDGTGFQRYLGELLDIVAQTNEPVREEEEEE
jgi:hypothetical protein